MSIWIVHRAEGGGIASTQLIDAATPREAAEKFTCSVLCLRNGFDVEVQEWDPEKAFHREYAIKGSGEWPWNPRDTSCSNPVTLEREVAQSGQEGSP